MLANKEGMTSECTKFRAHKMPTILSEPKNPLAENGQVCAQLYGLDQEVEEIGCLRLNLLDITFHDKHYKFEETVNVL